MFANTNSTKRPNPYVFVLEGRRRLLRPCVREGGNQMLPTFAVLVTLHVPIFLNYFLLLFRLFGKNRFKEGKKKKRDEGLIMMQNKKGEDANVYALLHSSTNHLFKII